MGLSHYDPVPPRKQQELARAFKRTDELAPFFFERRYKTPDPSLIDGLPGRTPGGCDRVLGIRERRALALERQARRFDVTRLMMAGSMRCSASTLTGGSAPATADVIQHNHSRAGLPSAGTSFASACAGSVLGHEPSFALPIQVVMRHHKQRAVQAVQFEQRLFRRRGRACTTLGKTVVAIAQTTASSPENFRYSGLL